MVSVGLRTQVGVFAFAQAAQVDCSIWSNGKRSVDRLIYDEPRQKLTRLFSDRMSLLPASLHLYAVTESDLLRA